MPPINTTGLMIASLIPLIVGSLWYTPMFFGNVLARQNETTAEKKGHHPMVYILTLICSILISMLIGAIIGGHEVEEITWAHGAFHGFGAAVFLGIPAFVVIAIFEQKRFAYILIHAGYWLVSMTIMGAILGFFGS